MFKRKTVLVLGAGASYEVGLPLGKELKDQIRNAAGSIYSVLKEDGSFLANTLAGAGIYNDGDLLAYATEIYEGVVHQSSIDNFLNLRGERQQVVTLGKYLIGRIIAGAEKSSCVATRIGRPGYVRAPDPSDDAAKSLEASWYPAFFRLLTEQNASVTGLADEIFSNLTVVNFNYDRTLELYLADAVASALFCRHEYALDFIKENFCKLRPYGRLGTHETYGKAGASAQAAAKEIKTFTETCETQTLDSIRKAVSSAQQIICLGFGYHQQNMQLLFEKSNSTKSRPIVYGTRTYLEDVEVSEISSRLLEMNIPSNFCQEKTWGCTKFLQAFGRMFTN